MHRAPSVRAELQQEVVLHASSQEREQYDNLAELFAIVQTIEYLEKAYIKDAITPKEYTPACERLIAQYKTAQALVKDVVPSLHEFMKDYRLNAPAALSRLEIGVPATIEHGGTGEADSRKSAMHVAEAVQNFITLMDSLKLNLVAVDQIHPLLNDLLESLNKLSTLSPTWEGKVKVKNWLLTLNKMKASDELTEDQVRQLLFDLESAHNMFYRSLADHS